MATRAYKVGDWRGFLRDTAQEAVLTMLPVFNGVSASGCLQCNFRCWFSEYSQGDTVMVPLPGASRQSFQRSVGHMNMESSLAAKWRGPFLENLWS